ncbi:hypothetical protein GW17_00027866 [Ensete ventricosum]|nr:hypothetical protein GW17_00027866 [Ensete ventricosum]
MSLLCPASTATLPLRLFMQRLPMPVGSHPAKGRPTLRPVPLPLLTIGLAVGSSPLRVPCSLPYLRVPRCKLVSPRAAAAPCGLLPLQATPASLAGWPWLQPAAPLQGILAAA